MPPPSDAQPHNRWPDQPAIDPHGSLLNSPPRGRLNPPPEFLHRNLARDGVADFLEAGEVPEIRKVTALLWLHRLDRAVVADEEFAFAVRLFQQRKSLPIRAQPRVPGNEVSFAEAEMRGDAGNLCLRQAHLPRPPATRRATLTFIEDRHALISTATRLRGQRKSPGLKPNRGANESANQATGAGAGVGAGAGAGA